MCVCLCDTNELDSLLLLYMFVCLCVLRQKMRAPLLRVHPSALGLIGVCALILAQQLFQKLKNLMRPYSVEFESPLELSAQGKEMIEMYFDFRLYRLWKTRQHSKLLDYEDFL
ncbi:hypothetical protein INR49_015137 [Caranx melampygus]|nr:hypothetical protein INR49_015137 [Caranx melampygus]